MKPLSHHRIGAALASLAFSVLPAAAQTGGIEVRVFDESGRQPVAGATVTLSSEFRFVATTTISTGKAGVASFPVLRPGGGYVVDVEAAGFARVRVPGVHVKIQGVTRIPIRLMPEIQEKVVVVEKRGETELDKTTQATVLDDTFLQDLPSQGRFYQGRLTLAPGVLDTKGDGNPNVHGARAVDFQAQVGGISNQDPLTGGWMSYVNPDSIEEMTVIQAGAGVEFGRAQGGFAQIVQKQGSNDLEGVANVLWRSSLMDGDATRQTPGTRVPKYDWIQPAIQVSGPLIKDRLWYRLSHEYISREEPIAARDRPIISARRQGIHADQLTWQVSPRNKLAVELRYDPVTQTNVGSSVLTAADSTRRVETGGPTWALSWTSAVSPSILVDTVVSYQHGSLNILPSSTTSPNDCVAGFVSPRTGVPLLPLLDTVGCTNTRTGVTSGSYPWTSRDDRERLTVKSQASLFAGQFLGMPYQFKVGFNIENERYFRDLETRPQLTFFQYKLPIAGVDPSGQRHPVEVASLAMQVASPPTTSSKATNLSYGLFVEDQVKPLSTLTLTAGLRVDREEIRGLGWRPFDPATEFEDFRRRLAASGGNVFLAGSQAFTAFGPFDDLLVGVAAATGLSELFLSQQFSVGLQSTENWLNQRSPAEMDNANTTLSPRMSLAWDPGGNGRSKIAMTAGRYYGTTFLAVPLVEQQPTTLSMSLTAQRFVGDSVWQNPRFSRGFDPALSVRVVDHDLRTPFQDEVTLSLEHEIGAETTARVAFIRRRFKDQFQEVDINHRTADYGRCVVQVSGTDPWVLSPPDGILDDCDGIVEHPPIPSECTYENPYCVYPLPLHRSDGFLDTYVYNPAWGAIYRVGNQGKARYDAVILELVRRQYRNWQMQASYTWSRALGSAEEFTSYLGDDPANRDTGNGYLAYDRRHVVKLNATTITPWGFRFGTAANWMSGLPYSILRINTSVDSTPTEFGGLFGSSSRTRVLYPTHRRNDRRNRPTLTLDVKFDKEMNLSGGKNLQVSVEVFNLLNDRYYQVYNPSLGFGRQVNEKNDATITPGRQYQIGLRLAF